MKKVFVLAIVFATLAHADGRTSAERNRRVKLAPAEKPATDKNSESDIPDDPSIEAKNAYQGDVPIVFDQENTDHGHHRDMLEEVIVVGHVALDFRLYTEKIHDEEGWRHLPGTDKKLNADVRMKIVDIAPDLSGFTVDISTSHRFLKGALSDAKSQEFSSRYSAKLVSCDGVRPSGHEELENLRSMIKDLREEDFASYLGCQLALTNEFNEKTFSADPFDFLADHKETIQMASSGSEVCGGFNLLIGRRGTATLASTDRLNAQSTLGGRSANFTLKATPLRATESREQVMAMAQAIHDDILKVAEGVEMGTSPDAGPAENNMVLKAAFKRVRESLRGNLNSLHKEFSKLSIQDQFNVVLKIMRAYSMFDAATVAAAKHSAIQGPKLNLDLEPQ